MNQAKIPRTIVQYVVPGSPAFVAGLYAGDQILSVNEQNLKTAPVSEVVKAIQEADSNKYVHVCKFVCVSMYVQYMSIKYHHTVTIITLVLLPV